MKKFFNSNMFMGRFILLVFPIVFICSSVFTTQCFANRYVVINGGGSGAAKAGSLGFEFGNTKAINYTIPMAFEISAAFTKDQAPSDILDYPVPHNSYRSLGSFNKGAEYGMLLKTGYTWDDLSILGGLGVSFQEKLDVAQSTVTGWYYTQSSTTEMYGEFYAGGLYKIEKLIISTGYNNRRGVVVGLGYSW